MLQEERPRSVVGSAAELAPTGRLAMVVGLCLLVMMLEGYETGALGNVVPVLAKDWGVTPAVFSWPLAASSIGMVFSAIAAGFVANRIGRKPVLVGSVALFAIGSLLCALAGSPAAMGWLRVITGLGMGAVVPMIVAIVTYECRGRNQGLFVMTASIGLPLGQLLGGLLAAQLIKSSWQLVFVVGGVISLVVFALLWAFIPKLAVAPSESAALRGRDLGKLFASGRGAITVLLWLIVFLQFTCNYFVISWLPTILNANGMQTSGAISFATIYPFGAFIALFFLGWFLDRWGTEKTLALSILIGALAVFLLGVLNSAAGLMALLVAVLGIGVGGSQSAVNALTARVYPEQLRNAGSGWALGVGRIGNAAGPLLGGWFIAAGLTTPQMFVGLSIPVFVTAVLMASLGAIRLGHSRRRAHLVEGTIL